MKQIEKYVIVVLMLMASVVPAGFAEEQTEIVEKTFSISNKAFLQITADNGEIDIRTWDKNEVHLKMIKYGWGSDREEAEKNLKNIQVSIRKSGDRVVIRELERHKSYSVGFFDLFSRDFWHEKRWRKQQVDFILMVPRQTSLKLDSDEGDIFINGITGSMIVTVDEGDVELEDVSSDDLMITVDEGRVEIFNSRDIDRGFWKIDADEGRILMKDVQVDELDCNADEGDVVIKKGVFNKFWLSADEGNILVDFLPASTGKYQLETDEGDLEITLPKNCNLDLTLFTEEGYIRSDFDLYSRRRDDGYMLDDKIGRGGARLKGNVDEGNIILIKKNI